MTDTHPARHVAVGITLNAKASSLKITLYRFNQGGYTIAGGSNGSGGLSPLTYHCIGVGVAAGGSPPGYGLGM